MSEDFIHVGFGKLVKTGKSFKFEYEDSSSVFVRVFYASKKEIQEALENPRKKFKLWKRNATFKPLSCESHVS